MSPSGGHISRTVQYPPPVSRDTSWAGSRRPCQRTCCADSSNTWGATAVASTAHEAGPPPFCFAGHDVPADLAVPGADSAPAGHDVPSGSGRPFSEPDAVASGLLIDPGHRLIELFFRGMLAT